MSEARVGLGLGARGLKDKDWGPGVSDPYVIISRPSSSGGFHKLRTSEVKKNSLNPDWNDFLFSETELNGGDENLKLKIEVFDDDGKKGPDSKDKLLGTAYYSLRELEASATVRSPLQLGDGKKGKSAGNLLVRSVTRHEATKPQGGSGGYPAPGSGGYPAPGAGGYPAPGAGYPGAGAPAGGYPGAPGGGYPGAPGAPGGGYPGAPGAPGAGYPGVPGGYPGAGAGYAQPAYPPQPGYPAQQPVYPGAGGYPQAPGYPPAGAPGYPPAPGGYPPAGAPGYPPAPGAYPPAGAPGYPPAGGQGGFAYPPQ